MEKYRSMYKNNVNQLLPNICFAIINIYIMVTGKCMQLCLHTLTPSDRRTHQEPQRYNKRCVHQIYN